MCGARTCIYGQALTGPEENAMECPVCKAPMVALELDQVEVDYCTGCGGVWLDSEELELLLDGAENRDRVLASLVADPTIAEAKRRCPICDRKMEKVRVGKEEDQDVIIDRCKRNDGVWLDKGELLRVIRNGSTSDENPVQKLLIDMFGGRRR